MNRYWNLLGTLYPGDSYPILRINECSEMFYVSPEIHEYMDHREYSHKVYSNICKDLLAMEYEAIIKTKDQNSMLLIFAKNTDMVQVIWDAKMLYEQKSPKEDPNSFNGKEYTDYLIKSHNFSEFLIKNGVC